MASLRSVRPAVVLLALAPMVAGCGLYYEQRAERARSEYLKEHTNLPADIVLGIHDAEPVVGMTIEQLEVALGGELLLVRSSSDQTTVYERRGTYSSALFFFESGSLTSWDNWPGL